MYPTLYAVPQPVATLRRGVVGLGLAVSIMLGFDAAVLMAKTVAFAWRYSLLTKLDRDPLSVSPETIRVSDGFVSLMSGLHILLCLALFVVFLCWFAAARTNAGVYAPGRMSMPSGWSIGGWFLPLANCVLPLLVARDTYRGTREGRGGRPGSGGTVTVAWWVLLVAGSALGIAAGGTAGRHTRAALGHLPEVKQAAALYCVGNPVLVAAAVAAMIYVQTVTSTQKQRNAEFAPGTAGYGYPGGGLMPVYPPPGGYAQMPGPMPVSYQPQLPPQGPMPVPVPEYLPVSSAPAPGPDDTATPDTATEPGPEPEVQPEPGPTPETPLAPPS